MQKSEGYVYVLIPKKLVGRFIKEYNAVPCVQGVNVISDERMLEIKKLLRPDEVANILRISKTQVYYLARMGRLEVRKIGENTIRITTESVKRLLEEEDN